MPTHITRSFLSTSVLIASVALAAFHPASPLVATVCAADSVTDPAADSILDQSVKALGGEDAISKIKSMHAEVDINANGQVIKMELSWSRSGGRFMKVIVPMGEMLEGTDGTTSWRKTPMGVQVITDKQEATQLNQQASMFMNFLEPKNMAKQAMKSVTSAGTKTFDGKDCDCLHFVDLQGKEGDICYDASTHMPVGSQTAEDPADPAAKSTMTMSDWQPQNDIQFFRTITFTSSQLTQPAVMKITKIEINTVDDSIFAKPVEPAGAGHPAATHPASTQPAASQPEAAAAPAAEIRFADLTADQQAKATQMLENIRKANDIDSTRQMVQRLEPMLGMIPADQRPTMQYVVQELKKDIAKAGG